MRERIEEKINEVIEFILAKSPEDITYGEYRILDCREKDLRFLEEQKLRNEEMGHMMAKAFGGSFCLSSSGLPEPDIKEE